MSRLFVYGDSYAAPKGAWDVEKKYNFKTYYEYLGELLGCESASVFGMQGASNTWIVDRLMQTSSTHTPEDFCIVILTDSGRKWFWFDKPQITNYMHLTDFDRFLKPEEIDAVKKYYLYLHDPEINLIEFNQHIRAVLASTVANTRIVGAFNNVTGQVSNLTERSVNEYQGGLDHMNKDYQIRGQGFDPRLNHLSEINHTKLAELLYDWFQTSDGVLDLTQLHENIIPDK